MSLRNNLSPYWVAQSLLSRREYSELELRQRLVKRGYSEFVVDETLRALIGENLLSDKRYALSVVRSRAARGFGPAFIAHYLKQHGVDVELIDQVMNESSIDWLAVLREVWEKKFSRAPDSVEEDSKQRQFFYRRGFSSEMINTLMRRCKEDGAVDR